MRTPVAALGVTLLMIASCAGERAAEQVAAEPAAEQVAAEPAAEQASEALAEESVVAYDSSTLGALQVDAVSESPVDFFDVLDVDGARAINGNPKLLGGTLELAPGTYVVDVNRTQRTVQIEAGKKTILQTGELVVEGEPESAYWWPMQGTERRLSSNPALLNRPRALFPGTYTVFVHTSVTVADRNLGEAVVEAGRTTSLRHQG